MCTSSEELGLMDMLNMCLMRPGMNGSKHTTINWKCTMAWVTVVGLSIKLGGQAVKLEASLLGH